MEPCGTVPEGDHHRYGTAERHATRRVRRIDPSLRATVPRQPRFNRQGTIARPPSRRGPESAAEPGPGKTMPLTAAVIGGGISGLASALRVAAQGTRVTL